MSSYNTTDICYIKKKKRFRLQLRGLSMSLVTLKPILMSEQKPSILTQSCPTLLPTILLKPKYSHSLMMGFQLY